MMITLDPVFELGSLVKHRASLDEVAFVVVKYSVETSKDLIPSSEISYVCNNPSLGYFEFSEQELELVEAVNGHN